MGTTPSQTLDTFRNPKPERDYLIRFETPENPDYVVITFAPQRIEYYHGMTMDVWQG